MTRPFIMVAPTGARRSKADHTALPVTLPEILQAARTCHAAGADALHLHIRDANGAHTLDAGQYRETLQELARAVPTLRIQITTEAAGRFSVNDQLDCLTALRPGWASISIREIARDPALAPKVYATCADDGTNVQHIVYDAADMSLLRHWQAVGIVRPGQTDVLCVLGRYGNDGGAGPEALAHFLPHLPDTGQWMACAFGPQEHACLARVAGLGGALRVGFENSLLNAQGIAHSDNAASVAALINLIERKAA